LTEVLKVPNIFEYDLVGYFNNISHRCVVRQLARFKVPKHVIMLIIEMNCGEVTAQSTEELLDCMGISETYEGSSGSFTDDWNKHEYLHKYRNGYRNRGFPQGGCLSPLVSIMPLILIEELGN
jgi:hypothetical protein